MNNEMINRLPALAVIIRNDKHAKAFHKMHKKIHKCFRDGHRIVFEKIELTERQIRRSVKSFSVLSFPGIVNTEICMEFPQDHFKDYKLQ